MDEESNKWNTNRVLNSLIQEIEYYKQKNEYDSIKEYSSKKRVQERQYKQMVKDKKFSIWKRVKKTQ